MARKRGTRGPRSAAANERRTARRQETVPETCGVCGSAVGHRPGCSASAGESAAQAEAKAEEAKVEEWEVVEPEPVEVPLPWNALLSPITSDSELDTRFQ